MGARSYVLIVSASILLALLLPGATAAAPPDDSTNSSVDPFLLESDYLWTDDTAGYTPLDGEPGTVADPNRTDPSSGCDPEGMMAPSWWQIHGSGRRTIISTANAGTSYDTVLAVYEEGVGQTIGDYVGCVDDSGTTRAEVELDPTDPNKDYLI